MQLTALALAITTAFGSFDIKSIFADGTPGFRINIEEAIRLNQQALGPELVSNGTFTDGTAGWVGQIGGTISSAGGELVVTGDGVQLARASTAVATIPGRTYAFLATLRIGTLASGNLAILASNNANLSSSFGFQDSGRPSTNLRAATFFTATAATTYIGVGATAIASGTFFADNISVREIDLSKCVAFQDSAGTLPVTAMEQPLGLILDTKAGVPVRGVDIFTMKSPAAYFNLGQSDAGWTEATGFKSLDFVDVSPNSAYEVTPIGGSADRLRVQFEISGSTYVYDAAQSPDAFSWSTSRIIRTPANATKMRLYFGTASATVTGLTVKELPGNHFVQPSNTASRPIVSRRVNRATNTGFTLGAVGAVPTDWIERGNVTGRVIEDAAAPSGRAMRVTVSAGGGFAATSDVRAAVTELVPATYKLMILAKRVSGGEGMLAQGGASQPATLTLTNQYAWYEATMTATGSSHSLFFGGASAVTYDIAAVDVRLSSDVPGLPSYQRVTSATDYDEAGFPAYARFDGLDDWLETGGTVDMTSTDAVTVLSGVTKLSDAAAGVLVESSTTSSTTPGTVALFAPNSPAQPTYMYRSRGSSVVDALRSGWSAPSKALLSGVSKISTDTAVLRINGAQAASSSADQGTGNYGNHKFYLGRRGGASLPFNGRIYGVTVVGKLLDTDTLNKAEQTERSLGRLY